MSAPATAPAPSPSPARKAGGWIRTFIVGTLALGSGIAGTYATQVVNTVIKPGKPVANFSVAADGPGRSPAAEPGHGRIGLVGLRRRHLPVPFSADETVTIPTPNPAATPSS